MNGATANPMSRRYAWLGVASCMFAAAAAGLSSGSSIALFWCLLNVVVGCAALWFFWRSARTGRVERSQE